METGPKEGNRLLPRDETKDETSRIYTEGGGMYACIYKSDGCKRMLLLTEIAEHERYCKIRTFGCPFGIDYCVWRGRIGKLAAHLKVEHKVKSRGCSTVEWNVVKKFITENKFWAAIMKKDKRNFLIIIKGRPLTTGEHEMFITVMLMEKDVEKYYYSVVFQTLRCSRDWRGTPASIYEPHHSFKFLLNHDLGIQVDDLNIRISITVHIGIKR